MYTIERLRELVKEVDHSDDPNASWDRDGVTLRALLRVALLYAEDEKEFDRVVATYGMEDLIGFAGGAADYESFRSFV